MMSTRTVEEDRAEFGHLSSYIIASAGGTVPITGEDRERFKKMEPLNMAISNSSNEAKSV